jgi:hypothetical protein
MRKAGSGIRVASLIGAVLSFQGSAWADPPPTPAPAAAQPAPAAAQPAAKAAKQAPAKSAEQQRFDAALQKLASGDPAVVQSGIDALVEHGGPAAERALIERVTLGLPPSLIEPALQGLVKLKAKKSVPVLVELLEHRRALVRSEALRALSQLDTRKPSPLQATFVAALGDPASEVSRAAAEGLGRIGTKAALPALWSAYDKGVTPAIASIAELAGPESVEALITRTQASGIETLEPVVSRMLARNALPPGAQVKLVRAIASTKSEGAHQYLLKWLERIKMQSQAQVKKELFEALKVFSTPSGGPAESAQQVAVRPATSSQGGAR